MSAPPLLAAKDLTLSFGGRPLFTGVTLQVGRGDKCCLIGRNGSGKSTLLRLLAGELLPDQGLIFRQPGCRLALLAQDPVTGDAPIRDWVAAGLPADEQDQVHRVALLLDAFALTGERSAAALSGGEARRMALARALVGDPDILLLDEPTNHLDLPTILQLETLLAGFKGALVMISHDRAFLERVGRQTLWLDRGQVRRNDAGFAGFAAWQEEVMAAEAAELQRLDKKLVAETHWLHRGVTARRKRNMGRLQALVALRQRRAEYLAPQGGVGLATDSGALSGKLVIEAKQISKALGGRTLVEAFSTRIMRGDRVGIIGANGAGKTTLLRLLTGTLPPDQGTVRLGANLQLAMVDQQRAALDPDATLWHSLTDGAGDSITVRGTPRHVMGYLRDFNFEDRQAHSPVRSLSGGERNRLLLAKLLAKPANLLVLDEPTNDLDMDTLDLLEDTLADFDGTLLLVSHDRDFLDRLVSSVLWVEGDGRVREYVGGYSEALRQRSRAPESGGRGAGAKALPKPLPQTEPSSRRAKAVAARLTYKDQRELEQLPAHLDRLAAEITRLEGQLSDPSLYAGDSAGVVRLGARLAQLQAEQGQAEERWLALELQREQGGG